MKKVFEELIDKFNLIPISNYALVNQNGDYLILTGASFKTPNMKNLEFDIVLARNSLENDVYPTLERVESLEHKLFVFGATSFKQSIVKGIKQSFAKNGELYAYIISVEIDIKRVKKEF